MQKTNIYKLLTLIMILALLPGCSALKGSGGQDKDSAQEKPGRNDQKKEISERDRLRSTAMMIDGSRQKMLGNYPEAAVLFHAATEADPENDAAFYELAKIHAMHGEHVDALKYIERAVMLSSQNLYYLAVKADIHILNNQLDQAVRVLEELVQLDPENMEYAWSLAGAYRHSNQLDKALAMLDYMQQQQGFSPEISIEKQKILVARGEYHKAIEEAEKLWQFYPGESMYAELLGELYRETGQSEKARSLYEQMLAQDPENVLAHLLLADHYIEQGNAEKAFSYLKPAFRNQMLDVDAKMRIVFSYYQLSENNPEFLAQAFALCDMMIEIHPDEPESYLVYGDFLNRDGRYSEARDKFLRAAELDPARLEVWLAILNLDLKLEDFQAMYRHADSSLGYFFEQPALFLFAGLAAMQLENYAEAVSQLEYGLQLLVDNASLQQEFLSMLGDAHHYLDNFARSDRYYEQALKLDPQNATVLNNYAYHLALRAERLEQAEAMARKAVDQRPDNPAFLDTYGWVLYRMGRYEEARQWILKSIQASEAAGEKPGAVVVEHYGDALYKLGKTTEALVQWKRARELGQGGRFLDQKIKDGSLYE